MPSGTTFNLNESSQPVTLDSDGNATAFVAPNGTEKWNVNRYGVLTNQDPVATTIPICKLYMDSVADANFIDGTYTGNQDAGDGNIILEKNQKLYAVWTGGIPGSIATLSVFGTRELY